MLTAGLAVLAAVAIPTLAGAGHQPDSVASYTGCLTPPGLGGAVYFLKQGNTPSVPCKSGHAQVHLSGGDITAVAADAGLVGGATNGSATISLADGGVTSAKLADGAVGSEAVADGSLGAAEFSTSIPAVRAFHSVAQSTAGDGSTTVLAFDSERYDTASMHDTSTDNSRLTAPVTGIYAITASVAWASNPAGRRTIHLRRSGLESIAVDSRAANGGDEVGTVIATHARLAAGDYVEVLIQQTSGASLNIQKGGEHSPEVTMTWLAPGP